MAEMAAPRLLDFWLWKRKQTASFRYPVAFSDWIVHSAGWKVYSQSLHLSQCYFLRQIANLQVSRRKHGRNCSSQPLTSLRDSEWFQSRNLTWVSQFLLWKTDVSVKNNGSPWIFPSHNINQFSNCKTGVWFWDLYILMITDVSAHCFVASRIWDPPYHSRLRKHAHIHILEVLLDH